MIIIAKPNIILNTHTNRLGMNESKKLLHKPIIRTINTYPGSYCNVNSVNI